MAQHIIQKHSSLHFAAFHTKPNSQILNTSPPKKNAQCHQLNLITKGKSEQNFYPALVVVTKYYSM